jgi:hypothetical protein
MVPTVPPRRLEKQLGGILGGTVGARPAHVHLPLGYNLWRQSREFVPETATTPFDTIESAQEYIDLLLQAIDETRRDVGSEIRMSAGPERERRAEALQLVALNLNKLSCHVAKSRHILNDLRTLRRLLLEERMMVASAKSDSRAAGAA